MKCLVLLAVLGGWAASLFAAEPPTAPLTPGSYLLVYKDSTAGGYMNEVKITLAEQKDQSLTVQSGKVEDMDPPAAPSPVTQRDGRFTFTIIYTAPDPNSNGKKASPQPCTLFGWADSTRDPLTGETNLKPGVFRGLMALLSDAKSYTGEFLLYRLSDK